MRWLAVPLSLALLLAVVPAAQAGTDCTRERVVPIDGLEEASVKLCDVDGDGAPETYELLVPEIDLELSGEAAEDDWGDDRRLLADAGLTAGYPVAPTGETRLSAIDEDGDGSHERVYLTVFFKAALATDPGAALFIALEDNDDDGQHETAFVVTCARGTGCHSVTNPGSLVGFLIGFVPSLVLDEIEGVQVPTPSGLLPDNLP